MVGGGELPVSVRYVQGCLIRCDLTGWDYLSNVLSATIIYRLVELITSYSCSEARDEVLS